MNKIASIPDCPPLNHQLENAFTSVSGHQPGDPGKGVARITEAVTHTGYAKDMEAPVRMVVDKDAFDRTGNRSLEWTGKDKLGRSG